MKILHVCVMDAACGVGIVARRINAAMRANDIDSRLLVARKLTHDPSIRQIHNNLIGKAWMRAYPALEQQILRLQRSANSELRSLSLLPTGTLASINDSDVDIVQLHWTNQGTLSVAEIGRITKPLVWSPHDMWPFSGCEHYEGSNNLGRQARGYSRDSRAPHDGGLDLDRWNFRRKQKHWSKLDMTIVCPSRWLSDMSRASQLFARYPHHTVSYPLDLEIFRPQDCTPARRILRMPEDKAVIGFSGDTNDPRKGFDLLIASLAALPAATRARVALLLMGTAQVPPHLPPEIIVRPLGRLSDELSLVLFNATADMLAAPSRQDNMPLTVVEALSCGRPVAAFRIGGMPDLIEDRMQGCIVAPFDVRSYADAIAWMLEDTGRLRAMGAAARVKAEAMFDPAQIVAQYRTIYGNILFGRP